MACVDDTHTVYRLLNCTVFLHNAVMHPTYVGLLCIILETPFSCPQVVKGSMTFYPDKRHVLQPMYFPPNVFLKYSLIYQLKFLDEQKIWLM